MRLYISSPLGAAANLPRTLRRVARLYRKGVLDDSSTVWINSDVRESTFWILSWRPTCIVWIPASTSGTVRLARERIRWAATHKASSSDPDFDIHLDRLPAEQIKHVTVVVDHHHPTDHVQVLDRAAGSAAMVDGFYQGTLASVIDLKNFVAPPPEQRPVITKFAQSLAFVQGTRLLTTGMNRSQISHFEENVESFGIDVSPEFLTVLSDAIDTFDSGAGVLIERLGRSNQLAGSI